MIKSIQQFCQDGVKNLEKVMVDYSSDMTKIAEMVQGVTKRVVDLGLSIIAEEWENYDELLRKRKDLRSFSERRSGHFMQSQDNRSFCPCLLASQHAPCACRLLP